MFFGKVLTKQQPFKFNPQSVDQSQGQVLFLTNVSLTPNSKDSAFVYIKKDSTKFLIAPLSKQKSQTSLNIFISLLDDVQLLVQGNGIIHITGFYEPDKQTDLQMKPLNDTINTVSLQKQISPIEERQPITQNKQIQKLQLHHLAAHQDDDDQDDEDFDGEEEDDDIDSDQEDEENQHSKDNQSNEEEEEEEEEEKKPEKQIKQDFIPFSKNYPQQKSSPQIYQNAPFPYANRQNNNSAYSHPKNKTNNFNNNQNKSKNWKNKHEGNNNTHFDNKKHGQHHFKQGNKFNKSKANNSWNKK